MVIALTNDEIKILVYNKVRRGIPHQEAVQQVREEIETMEEVKKFDKAKKKAIKKHFDNEKK